MATHHEFSASQPIFTPREYVVLLGLLRDLRMPHDSSDHQYLRVATESCEEIGLMQGTAGGIRRSFAEAFWIRVIGDDQKGKHDSLASWTPRAEYRTELPTSNTWVQLQPGQGYYYNSIIYLDPSRPPGDNLVYDRYEGTAVNPETGEEIPSHLIRLAHHTPDGQEPTEPEVWMGPHPNTVLQVSRMKRIVLMSIQDSGPHRFDPSGFYDPQQEFHPNSDLN